MELMSNLTQEELLHLAIEATRKGEHGASISYLKEGVARFPQDANLAYVLGAELAQIGMYDKAEIEMQRAIDINPSLYTASFQLGLLQMTLGKVNEAKSSWANINNLPQSHSLWLFKTGLEKLAENNLSESRRLLELGVAANDFSPELTRDMNAVLETIKNNDDNAKSVGTVDSVAGQAWLNAYNLDDQ